MTMNLNSETAKLTWAGLLRRSVRRGTARRAPPRAEDYLRRRRKGKACLALTRAVLIILILFPSCVFAAPSENFMKQAIQFKEAGDLSGAEAAVKKALEAEPANADFHFELANLYAMRHDAQAKAGNPEPLKILGDAARELEQAVMVRPDFLAAHYNLGVVYKREKKIEKAREEFRRVLELDPRQAAAWVQIGETYEGQGFFDEAKDSYLSARELNYGNPEIEGALRDLEHHRDEAYKQSLRNTEPLGYSRFRNGFPYAAFAPGGPYGAEGTVTQKGQGVGQALPFLGAWLVQEFMKNRGNKDSV